MAEEIFLKKQYGLKENPFLDNIARVKWLSTWVNREEQLRIWRREISQLESEPKNSMVFIVGDYGTGKTQSLLKIVDEANKNKYIWTSFLNFRGEQRPSSPGLDFMFRVIQSIDFTRLERVKPRKQIVNAINKIPYIFEEVAITLNRCWDKDYNIRLLSRYIITGQTKPTKAELRELGIIRRIENVDIAKEYFAGILCMLKALDFKAFLIAFDEVEYLFSLVTRPQQSIYLALLRGLFDFPIGINVDVDAEEMARICIFLGISDDGFRRLREIESEEISLGGPTSPLLDRAKITSLTALDRASTRSIIEMRLRYNRISGRYEDEPLIPFDESFVDYIWELSEGKPRLIIDMCSQVLDAGMEHGIPELNKQTAEQLLKEREKI